MKTKITVAVDGPAGSGKSTIAKIVADRLGLLYIDSGAMYRAVTYYCIKKGCNLDNPQELISASGETDIRLTKIDNTLKVYVNGEEITEQIRIREVTNNVFKIAREPLIRERLVEQQQKYAEIDSVIMDGRDIGTVVFPNAEVKIYLDASVDERTSRRYKELSAKGETVDFEKLRAEVIARDNSDKNRAVGPLKIADDAIVIDTTGLNIEQVSDKIIQIINKL